MGDTERRTETEREGGREAERGNKDGKNYVPFLGNCVEKRMS